MRKLFFTFFLAVCLASLYESKADGQDHAGELISILKTGSTVNQIQAVREIGSLGAQSHAAIPALVEVLKSEPLERTPLSSEIAQTLEKTGIDLPELLAKSVDGKDEVLSSHLCLVLAGGDSARVDKAANLLKLRLESSDPAIRRSAVDAINLLGMSDTDTVRHLIDLARDKDVRVSYRAISALGQVRPTKPEIAKALTILTKSSSAAIRYRAIASLGQIGSEAKIAVPNLASIARSGSGPIAKKAAEALAVIENKNLPTDVENGPLPVEAQGRAALDQSYKMESSSTPIQQEKVQSSEEAVVEAVNLAPQPSEANQIKIKTESNEARPAAAVENEVVRVEKLKALKFSEDREAASKATLSGLNDDSNLVKREAISKVTEAGDKASPELISGLEKILREGDPELRDASSQALIKMGTAGMAVMVAASSSNDQALKLKAIKALRNFDRPLTTEALIALRENLKDPEEQVRTQSAISLAMAKSVPNETIPLLIQTLGGNDLSSAVSATIALSKFSEDAVKPLISALNSPNPLVRSRAVTALGLMDPPPADISNLINPLLEDENLDVRSSAKQALSSIAAAQSEPEEEK